MMLFVLAFRQAVLARRLLALLALLAVVTAFPVAPKAQTTPSPPPAKVEELLKLLSDAEVQSWLQAQKATEAGSAKTDAVAEEERLLEANLQRIRRHLSALAAAIPALPQELGKVFEKVRSDMMGYGPVRMLLVFGIFLAAGLLAQWLFWHLAAGLRAWIAQSRLSTVKDRLTAILARLLYSAGSVIAFAAGSIGAFLAFGWPPRLHQSIVSYLVAVLIYRSARVLRESFLSPPHLKGFGDPSRFRVMPLSDESEFLGHAVQPGHRLVCLRWSDGGPARIPGPFHRLASARCLCFRRSAPCHCRGSRLESADQCEAIFRTVRKVLAQRRGQDLSAHALFHSALGLLG